MAGYDWSWQITLTFRKDNTYSVGAKQFVKEPPAYRVPSIYPLMNGKEVKEAIETIFQDDYLNNAYFEWHEIISAISRESPKLALEIKECLQSEEAKISVDKETNDRERLMDKYYSDMENIDAIRKLIKKISDKK